MKNSLGHMPLQLGQIVTANATLDNVNPTSQLCNITFFRSSCPEVFRQKDFLRNFAKFTRKHQYQGLMISGEWRPAIKKETLGQVFSCKIGEILRNLFLQSTSGRLLLCIEN